MEFYQLWASRSDVVVQLERLREEQGNRAAFEAKCAVDIQRLIRGRRVRGVVKRMVSAAVCMTRNYRGYRGRQRALRTAEERKAAEALAIYHYHALVIQSRYRGWQSRKYNYSHARRKAYLREVAEAGEAMRQGLREHQEALKQEELAREEARLVAESRRVAENLHHLVGTSATPGVYGGSAGRPPPTIRGVPVDAHLTTCVKDLLRARGYLRTELVRDLNGTLRAPAPAPPATRLSLQASSVYDPGGAAAARAEQALAKVLMLGPQRMNAGGSIPLERHRRGISGGSPFLDAWLNPYSVRGVPTSQVELRKPLRETSLGTAPAVPFVSAVGGNKSAVLPNKRFDVILEAQMTGGVVKRHLGRTTRFGVPETCDVRQPLGASLFPPAPPPPLLPSPMASTV